MATYKSIAYDQPLTAGGSQVLLSTFTSDGSDASASFDSSLITSTYNEYVFRWNIIHPETTGNWMFNGSIDNGSNYNVTKTTTHFSSGQKEDGSSTGVYYMAGQDLAQGTGYVDLQHDGTGAAADECSSGFVSLFNPSSTTFVKHFSTEASASTAGSSSVHSLVQGYFNTTSAINNIQFKFSSGEIQAGTIKLYGVN